MDRDPQAGTRATEWADGTAWVSEDYLLQVGIDSPSYQRRFEKVYPAAAGARTLFEVQLQKRPGGS